jgi:hypothetical protein
MTPPDLGAIMTAWARRQPAVTGLTLIGSRARAARDVVWRPDAHSDWDFQVITSQPELFLRRDWAQGLPGMKLLAYGVRPARIGGVPKVNAVFAGAEADFVVLPATVLAPLARAVRADRHRRPGPERGALQDLALVIRPGWRFLLGERTWGSMFRRVVADIPDARPDDAALRNLAECFWCDLVWIRRKLERGERVAAQRLLHQSLAETNLRLLHELRLRRGARSFPEGRRLERIAPVAEVRLATVSARATARELRTATEQAARNCTIVMRALVGREWTPPKVGG